jgi:starvation-inducible DNA-binding protein
MEPVSERLKIALASAFSFYLKAHYFHWNVTGPSFSEYHNFFGDVYTEVHASIDKYAEQLRAMGAFAPGSLNRMAELTSIQDIDTIPSGLGMIRILEADNGVLITEIYAAREYADAAGMYGLVGFLEERLAAHEKLRWMLKSFRGI